MNNKKRRTMLVLLVLILGITVGYALLSTTLKINGTSTITKNKWEIYWDSLGDVVKSDTTVVNTAAVIDPNDNTQVNFGIMLSLPGDFYEFQVDAVNNGDIDAMVKILTTTVNGNPITSLPSYVKYTNTYADGEEILPKHLLAKKNGDTPTRERVKVRIEYLRSVTNAQVNDMEDDEPYEFDIDLVYEQADEEAEERETTPTPVDFATDDWDTIAEEGEEAAKQQTVTNGKCGAYNIGDTRTIDMGTLGTHTVRIANCSTPAVCSTTGFSQTACGFVIEFVSIATSYRTNAYVENDITTPGTGSVGGWEDSDIRAYLNSKTYAYGNINYSTNGFYSKLPSDLKSKIIDTTVVSGHNANESNNFTTTDKLYLLSMHELWNDSDEENEIYGIHITDSAYSLTRQLDYYANNNVTIGNQSNNLQLAVKKDLNNAPMFYWLRTVDQQQYTYFISVNPGGSWGNSIVNYPQGVSPAFRIG